MTEEIIDVESEEVSQEVVEPIEQVSRNMFYANDAMQPPPHYASAADKKRYQQIKKSVKRLRRLERNPIFIIKMLDMKQENK